MKQISKVVSGVARIQRETMDLFGFGYRGQVVGFRTKTLDSASYFQILIYRMV